jgi:hypothetical protein
LTKQAELPGPTKMMFLSASFAFLFFKASQHADALELA